MRARLRVPLLVGAAAAAAEGATALLRPRAAVPVPVAVDERAYFSEQELVTARRFARGQRRLGLVSTAVELAVVGLAVARPPRSVAWSRRTAAGEGVAHLFSRSSAGVAPSVAGGALTAVGLSLATTVATLPLRAARVERARRVGLVTQGWGGWAADVAKATALGSVVAGGAGAGLVGAQHRLGQAWWAAAAGAAAGFGALVSFVAPVLLDPLFNDFTKLPEGRERSAVLELAAKADVDIGEVYSVDASRRTTAANAYVTGLGASRRVVLFDTLLEDFTHEEVRLVVAHELAHVAGRDMLRGIAWTALVAPAATLAAASLAGSLERPGRSPVPAVALAVTLTGTPVALLASRLSRALERRADAFAIELTHDPHTLVDFERRITVKNVADPAPPRWRRALASHPCTLERIGAALAAA